MISKLMIKIKYIIKCFVRMILQKLLCILPLKKCYIIFESYPELDCSPWMIYRELKRRGLDKKYKFIWAVDSSSKFTSTVKCEPFFGVCTIIQRLMRLRYLCSAKAIIDSNRYIKKINPKTFRMHTQHGAPLKGCWLYTQNLGEVDCLLSLSENMACIEQQLYPSTCGHIQVLGYPTNDRLFEYIDLYQNSFWKKLTGLESRYKKIIGWLPTYRQHRQHKKSSSLNSDYVFPLGVPLLKTHEDLKRLNQFLQSKNILLTIQMHHAQMENFPKQKFSNIVLIPGSLKQRLGVSTANLMTNFDALITDYSAAYHEYLLLDRPIALSIDDYEAYAKHPGFVLDYFDWIKGVYLKDVSDLFRFIEEVYEGVDSAKIERDCSMRRIHQYIDNQSTKRVVDFLIEKAKL